MFNLNYNESIQAAKTAVESHLSGTYIGQLKSYQNSAFQVTTLCTPKQLELISDIMKPVPVMVSPSKIKNNPRQHPIHAVLNEYSNYKSREYSKLLRSHGARTINIGGRGQDLIYYDHVCTSLEKIRDCSRYVKDKMVDGTNHCTSGSENCYVKASHGFIIDAIYDLTPEIMHDVFLNHELQQVEAWLHVDFEFYSPFYKYKNHPSWEFNDLKEKQIYTQCIYNAKSNKPDHHLNYKQVEGYKAMNFGDGSYDYIHDAKTWQIWTTCNALYFRDFTITIERVQTFGNYVHLQLIKVKSDPTAATHLLNVQKLNNNCSFLRKLKINFTKADNSTLSSAKVIPVHSIRLDDSLVLIPDFEKILRLKPDVLNWNENSFYTPIDRKLFNDVTSFAANQPDLNINRIAQHFRAKVSTIMFAGHKLYQGKDYDVDEVNNLVINIAIYTARLRYIRTQTTAKGLQQLSEEQKDKNWFISLFSDMVNAIKDEIGSYNVKDKISTLRNCIDDPPPFMIRQMMQMVVKKDTLKIIDNALFVNTNWVDPTTCKLTIPVIEEITNEPTIKKIRIGDILSYKTNKTKLSELHIYSANVIAVFVDGLPATDDDISNCTNVYFEIDNPLDVYDELTHGARNNIINNINNPNTSTNNNSNNTNNANAPSSTTPSTTTTTSTTPSNTNVGTTNNNTTNTTIPPASAPPAPTTDSNATSATITNPQNSNVSSQDTSSLINSTTTTPAHTVNSNTVTKNNVKIYRYEIRDANNKLLDYGTRLDTAEEVEKYFLSLYHVTHIELKKNNFKFIIDHKTTSAINDSTNTSQLQAITQPKQEDNQTQADANNDSAAPQSNEKVLTALAEVLKVIDDQAPVQNTVIKKNDDNNEIDRNDLVHNVVFMCIAEFNNVGSATTIQVLDNTTLKEAIETLHKAKPNIRGYKYHIVAGGHDNVPYKINKDETFNYFFKNYIECVIGINKVYKKIAVKAYRTTEDLVVYANNCNIQNPIIYCPNVIDVANKELLLSFDDTFEIQEKKIEINHQITLNLLESDGTIIDSEVRDVLDNFKIAELLAFAKIVFKREDLEFISKYSQEALVIDHYREEPANFHIIKPLKTIAFNDEVQVNVIPMALEDNEVNITETYSEKMFYDKKMNNVICHINDNGQERNIKATLRNENKDDSDADLNVFTTEHKCLQTILYNPRSDGNCGSLCLAYFLLDKQALKWISDTLYKYKGLDRWLSAVDIYNICGYYCNLIMHTPNGIFKFDNDFDTTLKLLLIDNHWRVVKCSCVLNNSDSVPHSIYSKNRFYVQESEEEEEDEEVEINPVDTEQFERDKNALKLAGILSHNCMCENHDLQVIQEKVNGAITNVKWYINPLNAFDSEKLDGIKRVYIYHINNEVSTLRYCYMGYSDLQRYSPNEQAKLKTLFNDAKAKGHTPGFKMYVVNSLNNNDNYKVYSLIDDVNNQPENPLDVKTANSLLQNPLSPVKVTGVNTKFNIDFELIENNRYLMVFKDIEKIIHEVTNIEGGQQAIIRNKLVNNLLSNDDYVYNLKYGLKGKNINTICNFKGINLNSEIKNIIKILNDDGVDYITNRMVITKNLSRYPNHILVCDDNYACLAERIVHQKRFYAQTITNLHAGAGKQTTYDVIPLREKLIYETPVNFDNSCRNEKKIKSNCANRSSEKLIQLIPDQNLSEFGCLPGGLLVDLVKSGFKHMLYGYEHKGDFGPLKDYEKFVREKRIISNPIDSFNKVKGTLVYDVPYIVDSKIRTSNYEKIINSGANTIIMKSYAYYDGDNGAQIINEQYELLKDFKYIYLVSEPRLRNLSSEVYIYASNDFQIKTNKRDMSDYIATIYCQPQKNDNVPRKNNFSWTDEEVDVTQEHINSLLTDFRILGLKGNVKKLFEELEKQSPRKVKVKYIQGTSGSGKSLFTREYFEKQKLKTKIVVPNNELEQEYKNKGFLVYTTLSMLTDHDYDNVVFDEYHQFYRAYLLLTGDAQVYMVGDENQIGQVDFNKCHADEKYNFPVYQGIINNRTSKDLEELVNKNSKHKIICNGPYNRTVTVMRTENVLADTIICFTQSSKQKLITKFPLKKIVTAHGSEGATYNDVAIYVGTKADYDETKRPEWIHVAVTRHTRSLMWFGDSQLIQQFFNLNNVIPINLDSANTFISDMQLQRPVVTKFRDGEVEELFTQTDLGKVLQPVAEVIVDKALPKYNDTQESNIVNDNLPIPESAKIKISLDTLQHQLKNVNSAILHTESRRLCKYYSANDNILGLQTMINRYMKKTKGAYNASKQADEMMKGFLSLINWTEKQLSDFLKPNVEDLIYHAKEYIISLEKKNLANYHLESIFEDVMSLNEGESINFMMKQQLKYIAKPFYDTLNKNGAGISAWTKISNIVFSAYSRWLESRFQLICNGDNNNIIYASGMSDKQLSEIVKDKLSPYEEGDLEHMDNDYVEWDSTNNKGTIEFECKILKMCLMPPELIKSFKLKRTEWRQFYYTNTSRQMPTNLNILNGELKMHSGYVFTLLFNTWNDLAIIGAIFIFEQIALGMAKGDDSHFAAKKIKIRDEMKAFFIEQGFNFKIEISEFGEFAGFYVSKFGLFPDVVRKTAKLLSADIFNESYYDERMTNLESDMKVILSNNSIIYNCSAISRSYARIGLDITPSDIETLTIFLTKARQYVKWPGKHTVSTAITYVNIPNVKK